MHYWDLPGFPPNVININKYFSLNSAQFTYFLNVVEFCCNFRIIEMNATENAYAHLEEFYGKMDKSSSYNFLVTFYLYVQHICDIFKIDLKMLFLSKTFITGLPFA